MPIGPDPINRFFVKMSKLEETFFPFRAKRYICRLLSVSPFWQEDLFPISVSSQWNGIWERSSEQGCQIFLDTIYQNGGKIKIYLQLNYLMSIKIYQMSYHIPNWHKIYEPVPVQCHQNLPKFGFFALKICHLATLVLSWFFCPFRRCFKSHICMHRFWGYLVPRSCKCLCRHSNF
jgi:hypothetical protein